MEKYRTSLMLNKDIILMAHARGLDVSAFINRSLALFLDLPEDPREHLIKIKTEEVVLRLRVQYTQEMQNAIKELSAQQTLEDTKKFNDDQARERLLAFGSLLQRTSCYDRVLEACQDLDPEHPVWQKAIEEVNRMNGKNYDFETFWNAAIEWHRRFYLVKTPSS